MLSESPNFWYKEFPDCGKKRQSPININSNLAEEAGHLRHFDIGDYLESGTINNMTVWNNGWTVTVQVESNIKIKGGGLEGIYSLRHFHLHWGFQNARGSEHSLNGNSYPMEVHIVHRKNKVKDKYEALKDPNGFAVFGVFVKTSTSQRYIFHTKFRSM
ncbi:hypothetical protein CHS0354_035975 [Potamilus streckersoni]|uniref:Carbonic anhydrase n=1 Tax=Potamilus streckersoni TaxID=2493646 RepID=A0AAE0SBI2_9BIVA|nr:hypothetical protein CHS0354_035975 [Potamilus streckersoni]